MIKAGIVGLLTLVIAGCGHSEWDSLCNGHKVVWTAGSTDREKTTARSEIAASVDRVMVSLRYDKMVGSAEPRFPMLDCPACDKLIDRQISLNPSR